MHSEARVLRNRSKGIDSTVRLWTEYLECSLRDVLCDVSSEVERERMERVQGFGLGFASWLGLDDRKASSPF